MLFNKYFMKYSNCQSLILMFLLIYQII